MREVPKPWLSVIVPVFNGESYLAESLTSLHAAGANAASGVEVLVVDDSSKDRSAEIARGFGDQLVLRLIAREENSGWVATTNLGLEQARGEYCCFLHQDDRWTASRLHVTRDRLAADPEIDLLLTAALFMDASGRNLGPWTCPLPRARLLPPHEVHSRLVVQNFIAVGAPVFRRRLVHSVGSLNPSLWYTADWNLWLDFCRAGSRILYDSRPTYEFRLHPASQTSRRSAIAQEFQSQLESVLDRHLSPAHPPALVRAARMSISINCALAARAHGQTAETSIAREVLRAGPVAICLYLSRSRILQRVVPRLLLRLRRGG